MTVPFRAKAVRGCGEKPLCSAALFVTPGPGRRWGATLLSGCALSRSLQPESDYATSAAGERQPAPRKDRTSRNAPSSPHIRPRASRIPHRRAPCEPPRPARPAVGGRGPGEARGYHATQADVLVISEDEHHVGPPRLSGCARRAQYQQRG